MTTLKIILATAGVLNLGYVILATGANTQERLVMALAALLQGTIAWVFQKRYAFGYNLGWIVIGLFTAAYILYGTWLFFAGSEANFNSPPFEAIICLVSGVVFGIVAGRWWSKQKSYFHLI
jgi:hypothetical protein